MTVDLPPERRAEMWAYRIIVETGGISVGGLRDRVPFGRTRLRETLKSLEESGRIFREANVLYPADPGPTKTDQNRPGDRPKATESDQSVPPHAPPPKDLKTGSKPTREGRPTTTVRDTDPYVVVCTWRELRIPFGLCDFTHQTFFGNRNDAHAHFKAHCREPHPSADWEVAMVERKTGENLATYSTQPYEPIPYEVAKLGLNAFIKSQMEKHRI